MCRKLRQTVLGLFLLWSATARGVNLVEVVPTDAPKGSTGVEVRVRLTNDITTRDVVIPLVIRQGTGGAFITSLKLGFGDRLPPGAGSPLSEIQVTNQLPNEDGTCKNNLPGGFGTVSSSDTLPHPVTGTAIGILMVRANTISPNLTPGTDAVGSLRLIVDFNTAQGSFLVDSTCTSPANHVLFVETGTNSTFYPQFASALIGVGYPPVARDSAWSTPEDTAKVVSYLPVFDGDAEPLTFTVYYGPFNGSLSGFNSSTGGFTYTPGPEYIGLDSLRFEVTDGVDTDSGTVRITVENVNDPPVARDTTVSLNEDTTVGSQFLASDVDHVSLVYVVLLGPYNGQLTSFDPGTGTYTYEPDSNFYGTDSAGFRATDGGGAFDEGVVTFSVDPINDPPIARDSLVTIPDGSAVTGQFHSWDIDGGAPTYAKADGPFNGTFTGFNSATGEFTYTPAPFYSGPDSIRFQAFDGADSSNVGVVRFDITGIVCSCPNHMDPDESNATDAVDLSIVIDAVFFNGDLYQGGPNCPASNVDYNCDCVIDALDLNQAIDVIFFNYTNYCDPCAEPCIK